MRNIINISLPVDLVKIVKKEVKRGKFASTSEYFRYLLRAQKEAGNIERAREDFRKGRNWKVLKSIKDLM
ncbi:MAG TPA: ribbon-helix-helix domain-containing protein [Candidatus Paceibacterota bacterium]